jgi:hypothetical protein
MPTLLELFQSKKLDNGQTAAQKYEIQNSKENKPSVANGFINTVAFPLQQIARRNLSNRTGETLIEEEVTGLRVLNTLASVNTYGTEIIRLTTQTTKEVDDMNAAANGTNANGLLTGILSTVRDAPRTLLSKIGIALPQNMIPTKVADYYEFSNGSSLKTMEILATIKKDGAGSLLGKLISQNAQGNPSQIGNQIVGGAIQAGKDALKNILLGGRKEGQRNIANITDTLYARYRNEHGKLSYDINTGDNKIFSYKHLVNDSDNSYETIIDEANTDVASRNDLSSILLKLKNNVPQKNLKRKFSGTGVSNKGNGQYGWNYDTKQFDTYTDSESESNEIGYVPIDKSLQVKRGFNYNTINEDGYASSGNYSDDLNLIVPYNESEETHGKLIRGDNNVVDDLDFISLKFYSVYQKSVVIFRATVTGLSETFRPTWDSSKFIGNAFNYYTYNSIERNVSFKFKVYSLTADEHIAAWQRLKYLASLTYPQNYEGESGYVTPPFIKFTLGDLYNQKEGFIESLTYTFDDNYPWEIGLNKDVMANYKLPMVIDVDIQIKFIESAVSHRKQIKVISKDSKGKETTTNKWDEGANLYAFGKPTNDSSKELDGSGAPTKNKAKGTSARDKANPAKEAPKKEISKFVAAPAKESAFSSALQSGNSLLNNPFG